MKKISLNILIAAAVMSFSASCSLDFEPTDAYSERTFWYSAANARSGMTACYLPLRNGSLYGGGTMAFEECVTPNAYNYHNNGGWDEIATGRQTSSTAIFDGRWNDAYIGIGRCNFLLANIDNNKELTKEDISQMKAQARFLRALYYSVLTTYYYKVPLITDPPSITQVDTPRTDRDVILAFIMTELDDVSKILPNRYVSTSDYGRATAGAALALKARLLNFEASPLMNTAGDTQKWQDAADAAFAVMNMGVYSLYNDYRELFTVDAEHGSESIFNVEAIQVPTGMGHSHDIIMRQYNSAAPLEDFVESYWMKDGLPRAQSIYAASAEYADLDPRFYSTIVYPGSRFMGETVVTDGTNNLFKIVQTGYTFRKYTIYDENKPKTGDENIGENGSPINRMILRYADVLLMYAEAMNETDQMSETVWNRTVKAIRQRAGFTAATALDYPTGGKAEITRQIRYERRIEFAGEAMYYNDLRRWKEAENVMNNLTIRKFDGTAITTRSFDKNRDYWWPVPASQMTAAPSLAPNNPGWTSSDAGQ